MKNGSWAVLVLRPRRILVNANAVGAYVAWSITAYFAYAWISAYGFPGLWQTLGTLIQLAAVGAFLSVTYFVCDFLDRRTKP